MTREEFVRLALEATSDALKNGMTDNEAQALHIVSVLEADGVFPRLGKFATLVEEKPEGYIEIFGTLEKFTTASGKSIALNVEVDNDQATRLQLAMLGCTGVKVIGVQGSLPFGKGEDKKGATPEEGAVEEHPGQMDIEEAAASSGEGDEAGAVEDVNSEIDGDATAPKEPETLTVQTKCKNWTAQITLYESAGQCDFVVGTGSKKDIVTLPRRTAVDRGTAIGDASDDINDAIEKIVRASLRKKARAAFEAAYERWTTQASDEADEGTAEPDEDVETDDVEETDDATVH